MKEEPGSDDTFSDATSDGRVPKLDRRDYMKVIGAATVAAPLASGASSARTTVNLGDKGLTEGDDIGPYLEQYVEDDTDVIVPEGTYAYGDSSSGTYSYTISANNFTLDGRGSTISPVAFQDKTIDESGDPDLYYPRLSIEGDDWEFGRILFDQVDEDIELHPSGAGWRIHHCGWDGEMVDSGSYINPDCPKGSEVELDSLWFGEGSPDYQSSSAIFFYKDSDGQITVKNSYFYQMGVYGVDTDTPADNVGRGVMHFENCYFENCYLACLRTGDYEGEHDAQVKNCTIWYSSQEETPESHGPPTSNLEPGSKGYRGVWAWYNHVDVIDCQIDVPWGAALVTAEGGTITMDGGDLSGSVGSGVTLKSNVGSNPDHTPPASCVTSATDAATGGSDLGTCTLPGTTTVRSTGDPVDFTIKTTGEIIPGGNGNEIECGSASQVVEGTVPADEERWFWFDGTVADVELDADATFFVNGTATNPDEFGNETYELPNTVTVRSTGSATDYAIHASGGLHPGGEGTSVFEGRAYSVSGTTSATAGEDDWYWFAGDLTHVDLSGDADLLVNGSNADPADYADTYSLSRNATVRSQGEPVRYTISADGGIRWGPDGREADSYRDSYTGVCSGTAGEDDWFWFAGSITDVEIEGEATFMIDGQEVDPDQYGNQTYSHADTVTVRSTGQQSAYSITVDGGINWGPDGQPAESEQTTVAGAVTENVGDEDWFWFDGSITDVTLQSGREAKLLVNGTEQDPADY